MSGFAGFSCQCHPSPPSASIDDNGAEHIHDISLKENAAKDCADVSDTSLLALAKPIVDALHALFMYIGPYEGDAVSLSHLPEATQEELISRVSPYFLRFVLRPLIASREVSLSTSIVPGGARSWIRTQRFKRSYKKP